MSNITFKTKLNTNKSIVFDLGRISNKKDFSVQKYEQLCFICTDRSDNKPYIKRSGLNSWSLLSPNSGGGGGGGGTGNANIQVVSVIPSSLDENTLYVLNQTCQSIVTDYNNKPYSISLKVLEDGLSGLTADSETVPSTLAVYNFVREYAGDIVTLSSTTSELSDKVITLQLSASNIQSSLSETASSLDLLQDRVIALQSSSTSDESLSSLISSLMLRIHQLQTQVSNQNLVYQFQIYQLGGSSQMDLSFQEGTITINFSKTQLNITSEIQFNVINPSGYNITTDTKLSRRWNGNNYEITMLNGWQTGVYKLKS